MRAVTSPADAAQYTAALAARYHEVRALSLALAEPLSAEDQCVQSMPDASPTKWHLAHTTWFFETLALRASLPGYRPFSEAFAYLFNSYYESLGARQARPERGLLTRPPLSEVLQYRAQVDEAMDALLATSIPVELAATIELGIQHEQQHQELILTDVKHLFSRNVLLPAHSAASQRPRTAPVALAWIEFEGGRCEVGHAGAGFAFDNECPRHAVLLPPFCLANRPTTCGEYLAFIADDGYRRPEFWLSDAWATVQAQGWRAPLYWREIDAEWHIFTLHGERLLDADEPVCHLSFYEAAAFANWAGARLPTEFEWEAAIGSAACDGHFIEAGRLHPEAAHPGTGLLQRFGDVWAWTRSSYDPYPGFRPFSGRASEYNGKFMVGQLVLRGGSCATPAGHVRASYRNFFPPAARWQFSGLRLAREC
ncbi:ergothioneine biosynthesis protein EgtB [Niveibacterium microcysteis]|uniref:Ergothioneine biosynthesis protein EgtB n=1 Tax=Niveibacterium microcysteis TaxID=2811415 RepID=A0ABX7M9H1_9RHOO|nr:ergothioneine biosynthesis protein EgtB [Niveibacterium microcysteis]